MSCTFSIADLEQTTQTCAYQPGCKPSYATDLDGTMLTQHWPGCLTSVDLHVIAGAGWCCGCALTQCFSFSSNSDRSNVTLGAKSAGTLQSLDDWRLRTAGSGWTGASLAIVLGVSYVMYGMPLGAIKECCRNTCVLV